MLRLDLTKRKRKIDMKEKLQRAVSEQLWQRCAPIQENINHFMCILYTKQHKSN